MKSGNLTLENNKISGEVVIDMLSLSNIDLPEGPGERLVGHLRSPDFFNVERFPTAKLSIQESRIVEKLGDGSYKMIINSLITIKGQTNPVSFEAKVNLDAEIKTAEGKLIFNRNDFNIQYRSEIHLDNPKTFWNKLQTTRDTAKDKVIRDLIEIDFKVLSMPGMISQ
jgi:polyisoprenoid-binding protein YceI